MDVAALAPRGNRGIEEVRLPLDQRQSLPQRLRNDPLSYVEVRFREPVIAQEMLLSLESENVFGRQSWREGAMYGGTV